jgi:DNA-binding LacI/PurR family transcriptional regulator
MGYMSRKKKRINSKLPGRVTVKDVAQELNISTMTVSRVLNKKPNVSEETREKVLQTALRLGYIPNHIARSLVTRKTFTIGVIVPEITHSFFPDVIRGIEEAVYKTGYNLLFIHSAEDSTREEEAIQTLASKQVDGILISTAQTVKDFTLYRRMIESGKPLIFFDRYVKRLGTSCVGIDDVDMAQRMTEHLIGHGYRRIAHLSGPKTVSIGRDRLRGYMKALAGASIPAPGELIVESGFHEQGGYRAMLSLLENSAVEIPRAVVAVNDPAAFGAMQAIVEKGYRIPDDIAVVGFSDDIRAPYASTPLTTVNQLPYEVGKKAAEKLLKHIDNPDEPVENLFIKTEQVIRRSCGCNGTSTS